MALSLDIQCLEHSYRWKYGTNNFKFDIIFFQKNLRINVGYPKHVRRKTYRVSVEFQKHIHRKTSSKVSDIRHLSCWKIDSNMSDIRHPWRRIFDTLDVEKPTPNVLEIWQC